MNIHEYQAKKLLNLYGISTPKGKIAYTSLEAKRAAEDVCKKGPWVLKAQIQSGGRSKGKFIEKHAGAKGGIRKVCSKKEVVLETTQMLGSTLVTYQSGKKGKFVSRVYVENFVDVKKVFYFAIAIDRSSASLVLLIAEYGQKTIEELLGKHANKVLRLKMGVNEGVESEQIFAILNYLDLDHKCYKSFEKFVNNAHRLFLEKDATMIEITPLGLQKNNELVALDAKISFDDNALYRHPDIAILKDDYEVDERALEASKYGFEYDQFDEGSVGCIVNGDGLALSVMDGLKSKGSAAACFLNVKGGVDKDKIASGIKLIMTNPRVEGVFIDILGGFLRCSLIAEGIVSAASEVGLNVPLVVRFEGTHKKEAIEILKRSNLPIMIAEDEEQGIETLIKTMQEND